MTKAELEQQAKEYGMTVSEIKEYRKHIKPFLELAIKYLTERPTCDNFLCHIAEFNYSDNDNLTQYLLKRIRFCRPLDSGKRSAWYCDDDGESIGTNKEVNKLKLKWCRQQLKLVKP